MRKDKLQKGETRSPARLRVSKRLCEGAPAFSIGDSSRLHQIALIGLITVLAGCTPTFDEQCAIEFEDGATVTLPVARSVRQQKRGLQERDDPAPGMVFVWPEADVRVLWMKNTPSPLSAAWIGADGYVQSIINMQPESTEKHSSLKPAIAVIELPLNGFDQLGVDRGDVVTKSECFAVGGSHAVR